MLDRLDVRAKLAGFVALMVATFCFTDPLANAALLALLLAGLIAMGTPLAGAWRMIRPLGPMLLLVVFFAVFFNQLARPDLQLELFSVWGLRATLGGLLVGLNYALRILLLVIATYAFSSSTTTDELLEVLSRLRAPHWFSIMLTTAIGFIPTMARKSEQIQQAQRARGARVRSSGPGAVLSYLPLMIPLLTNSLLLAEDLAVALTNRGYGANAAMTRMRDLRFGPADVVALMVSVLVAASALWLRFGVQLGVL